MSFVNEDPPPDRGLIWTLRLLGALDLLALVAIGMPLSWMSRINEYCGMGPFPETPLVGYLTRTSSTLYALHGAVLIFVSGDTERYRPFISFLALATIVHGACLLLIDLAVGMPLFWTVLEGPSFSATGALLLWLTRASGADRARNAQRVD